MRWRATRTPRSPPSRGAPCRQPAAGSPGPARHSRSTTRRRRDKARPPVVLGVMDQVGTGHPSFEALSAYHDAESTPAERSTLDVHLLRCTTCRKTLAGFDLLGMALQAAPATSC